MYSSDNGKNDEYSFICFLGKDIRIIKMKKNSKYLFRSRKDVAAYLLSLKNPCDRVSHRSFSTLCYFYCNEFYELLGCGVFSRNIFNIYKSEYLQIMLVESANRNTLWKIQRIYQLARVKLRRETMDTLTDCGQSFHRIFIIFQSILFRFNVSVEVKKLHNELFNRIYI